MIITLSLVVDAVLEPFIAIIADTLGHLIIISIGMVSMMLLSIPIFYALSSENMTLITSGLVLMSILISITYAPLNAYMVSLFPHQYRYSGFGVSFNIGISVFGATTPLVMMWLVDVTGSFIAPAWYYVFGTVTGLASLVLCEKSRHRADESFEMATN